MIRVFVSAHLKQNFFFFPNKARDSFKDLHSLHLPSERFSPVRRASDGVAGLQKHQAHLEKIYNQTISSTAPSPAGGGGGGGPSSRHSSHSSLKQLQLEHQELQVYLTVVVVKIVVEMHATRPCKGRQLEAADIRVL